jgi:predicted membrane chloride channel (bestrophin family)
MAQAYLACMEPGVPDRWWEGRFTRLWSSVLVTMRNTPR